MRRVSYLAIIAILSIALYTMTSSNAQQSNHVAGQTELRGLLVERRDTLQSVVDALDSRYKSGAVSFEPLAQARDEYLLAEMELADSKQERVELCERRVANLKENEEWITVKTEQGEAKSEERLLAAAARLQAEIDCARERLKP